MLKSAPWMVERLEVLRGVVHPWHHDIFGHMNVRHYAPFFDDASFHLYARLGLVPDQLVAEHGVHMVSARAETNFLVELRAGDLFVIDGVVTRLGNRSVTLQLRMVQAGTIHATYDLTEVFFDPATRRSAPMPGAVRAALSAHLLVSSV
jgi:acyl-CoA thioester hydrolase